MAYTIPREIIKWIQGLDLSYSYRDSKRDLMNGFLIAEILARYYPDKVQMHSFDNSGNQERRANNWMLLGKFFQKNELPFTKDDYSKILDNDFEALKLFLIKLYTMMTNRKVSKPPLSTLQHTGKESLNTRNDTELGTFLLRDKGLEPIKNIDEGLGTGDKKKGQDGANDLDASKKDDKDPALASNMSPPSNTKQKNLFRIPPRPIAQTVETSNTQVDVKSTNIRVLNTNIAKFRANKEVTQSISKTSLQPEAFQKSNNVNEPMTATGQERHSSVGGSNDTLRSSTSKKEKGVTERTIHDILNEILLSKVTHSQFHEEAQRVREIATSVSLFYSERIDNFSVAFHLAFFQEVKEKCESLVNFLIRDQNELWKFFMFLFTCIKGIPTDSDLFQVVDGVLKALGEKFLARDIQRTKSIYMEYFMGTICSMLKTSMYFEKKELLVKTVYYFIPNDYSSKYEVLRQFKIGLNNDLIIFSQVLAILIREETGFTAAPNQENFLREFADYAEICFRNPVNSVRSMSLAIFCKLADLRVEMILNSVLAKIPNFSAFKWWEHKCLALILLNKTIRGITNTDAYVNFIKKQTAHVSKTYTPEHEAIIHNIREQIDRISTCLRDLCSMNTSEQILRVALINFIPNIYEIKSLMDLFVGILLMTGENLRKWVIAGNDAAYREEYLVMSDKSLKYQVSIDTTKLKDYALEIIIAVVEAIKEQELETVGQEHFDLLQFAFQHLSFDKISPEEANFIANSLKDYLCVALCDEDFYQIALDLLQRLLFLHFKDQLQIKEIETFLASALVLMRQNSLENCIKNISDYLLELHREAIDNNLENIKRFLINIAKETRSKLGEKYDEQDVLAQLMDQITLGLDQD